MSYTTVNALFKGIADAVRSKDGTTDQIARQDLPSRISAIKQGIEPIVITDAAYLFSGQIPEEAYSIFKIVKPTIMNHMYYLNDAILNIDMTKLDFTPNPNAIACNNMFYNCDKLLTAELYPRIKAKTVMSMFQGCKSLTSFDLGGIDVTDCTDYRSFLNGCVALKEFDGSIFPNLQVVNNNCQNFFYATSKMRKIWLPKEWVMPNTTAGYSPFISNGGSNKMNASLQVFTDATSEADQIAAGNWSNVTLAYSSTGTKIPDAQMHYGSTHDEYLAY